MLSIARIIPLLFLLILVSCKNKDVKVPEEVIPEDKMIEVMIDVHLLEGARSGNSIIGSDSLYIQDYYEGLLQDHDLTVEEYEQSFKWYTEHPEVFKDVYQRVMERLSVMEAEAQKKAKEEFEEDQEVID
ncbi:MAG: DUF4296 domain-containing protein [Bacteroidota bacterium]|nr:DUF4296 domain-containing protein [Bacteroidota bacterium]